MTNEEYQWHKQMLEELDADELVCDLELESKDIVERFPTEVRRFIEENYQ
jgi:hypothetical protein